MMAALSRVLVLFCIFNLASGQGLTIGDPTYSHCQDITIPMCMEMPYKKTIYPNLMGHADQVCIFSHTVTP